MATLCVQTATPGHMTGPPLAGRGVLRPQRTPSWGSDGQRMLPVLANLWVKSHRRVSDLYATRRAADADAFRARLDRRLYDRYHAPVVWDVEPAARRPAA